MTTTYHIGQQIEVANSTYLIAQVWSHKCCLIDLSSGNRWEDPIEVIDPDNISEDEF